MSGDVCTQIQHVQRSYIILYVQQNGGGVVLVSVCQDNWRLGDLSLQNCRNSADYNIQHVQ